MIRGAWLWVLLTCLAGQAIADAPIRSPYPMPRPGVADVSAQDTVDETPLIASDEAIVVSPVPTPRPDERARAVAAALRTPPPVSPPKPNVVLAGRRSAVLVSPRPFARPENLQRRSVVRASGMVVRNPPPQTSSGRVTGVCGDAQIIGQTVAPIQGRIQGCGVANPVRVSSVAGVALTQPAILECSAAKALKTWMVNTAQPTVGRLGGGIASIRVAAHYSCRTRNNQPGAKISEHGRGKAIDISAINLRNGQSISVLKGWRDPSVGPVMKRLHAGACGPFGTVLGPNSDRFHQDHFHFDTARHGNGPYCR